MECDQERLQRGQLDNGPHPQDSAQQVGVFV